MTLVGVKLETFVSEPDALTTRPSPCAIYFNFFFFLKKQVEHGLDSNKDIFHNKIK